MRIMRVSVLIDVRNADKDGWRWKRDMKEPRGGWNSGKGHEDSAERI